MAILGRAEEVEADAGTTEEGGAVTADVDCRLEGRTLMED